MDFSWFQICFFANFFERKDSENKRFSYGLQWDKSENKPYIPVLKPLCMRHFLPLSTEREWLCPGSL